MLLSSSQVSALITTFIIISCTTALFLSGYMLQQRTVSQLRAAIRQHPLNPSPRPNLPDRFRSTTTELDDGTIIVLESEAQAEANQRDPVIVEVRPSIPDPAAAAAPAPPQQQQQKVLAPSPHDELAAELRATRESLEAARDLSERERNVRLLSEKNQLNPDPSAEDQKPISLAQRRRLIKEELFRLSHDDKPVHYQRRLH
ncbi:uncharacterized protein VDAG_02688 [Verticillium dahliae VdLs.17]|uniref:Uncharacterized protein n=1 Tax=Verticillium dahliae (strain VdLs.17 / ATCC MYA-4575 / FGSC 10137) TaxID=498257 RepID=G2WYK6_VERDV|nr:uncharacterized protein VDAG_02688 [Verticillium dahliae VdLs.17]EGY21164.1 hypothetical protein VDAG_02688 [Verticillium dahliae VdLs.17]